MRSVISFAAIVLTALLLSSCSGKASPIIPSEEIQDEFQITVSENYTVSDSLNHPYRGVFGVWKVIVDPVNLTAELIPSRNAHAIGDIFDADLLQFLTVSPCSNCLRITSINFSEEMALLMDIGIQHPFDNTGHMT